MDLKWKVATWAQFQILAEISDLYFLKISSNWSIFLRVWEHIDKVNFIVVWEVGEEEDSFSMNKEAKLVSRRRVIAWRNSWVNSGQSLFPLSPGNIKDWDFWSFRRRAYASPTLSMIILVISAHLSLFPSFLACLNSTTCPEAYLSSPKI